MQPEFIHLRLHSEYSLVDGIVKIKPLINTVAEAGMPAVAITDQSNLFSLVKFYRTALAKGIKPIAGADVHIFSPDDASQPFCLTLLVKNNAGYVTLTELISRAYQEGQHLGVPMLRREWIEQNHDGLIALSGAMEGDIGQALLADDQPRARKLAQFWSQLFPECFYLEIQRVGRKQEEQYLASAVSLATELDLPVVATNNVRFIKNDSFGAHEVRVCINQGRVIDDSRRPKDYTEQQFLRSTEEMQALFADIPEALANTVEIAKRCNIKLTLGKNFLPDFPVPEGMSLDEFFIAESEKGLNARIEKYPAIGNGTLEENRIAYDKRLKMELDIIVQMGFPGYFMIVADFIQWAKDNTIPVGPGRGSGAGSLVAYVLNITDLDPIEFDLLFERFLNPERVSMPDFDVDFCMDRRDEVIDYVARNYGRDKVSQIITYGSMAAKAVIRDVGRVLGHPYSFVDRLSKLVPFEIGMTLTKALSDVAEFQDLYDNDAEVKNLMDMALSLEGTVRNAGKHAGGVVIAPTKLTDFSPLYCEQGGGNLVTQFDKDDVEAVGLVKFDFLGLRTLTIIDWALKTINKKQVELNKPLIDITQIPRDDAASYVLLKNAETTAVFQLESRGMKELIKKLKPDCFDDIIALVALFRPGPLESGMVDDYINVKHGAKAEYAHPILIPVLEPTNGVILYQEQVMQIAREMGGYTLGGADLLRRAMGKKKVEEMAQQRTIFTKGAIANGIDEEIATYVFDLMEKFAGYGFNKSHSAAYALVAYQTAWLKAHYPAAFMAAVLSADMDNTDKIVILIAECQDMELTVSSPNINISNLKFTVNEGGEIVYGIGAIKGVGEAAIEDLLREREVNGPFDGLYDLCKRVDLRKVNRRVFEALIRGGAFDIFNENRASHMAELPTALRVAERHVKMAAVGQNDLFGLAVNAESQDDEVKDYAHKVPVWPEKERLAYEKLALGIFLTGHPIDQYWSELLNIVHGSIAKTMANVENSRGKSDVRLAGLLIGMRTRQDRKGRNMGFATLDDKSARVDVAIYSETFELYKDLLTTDEVLVVEGSARIDGYTGQLSVTAEKIYSLEQARESFARCLMLNWDSVATAKKTPDFIQCLQETLQPFSGGQCMLVINYLSTTAKASIQLGDEWRVHPTDELVLRLQRILKQDNATSIKYR
ncbi:DNA polymerase III subunit alpha [Methylococcaceae bacterium CS1]|nr:DNA polymerase III subunit alpha [Methyloprofundus sp.]TXK95727.1 DNA polymerase III subunit alpha [Methylococcaceae bacterium CS4]TXK96943.1 DNA polymerase III subunit alpha [Methylococcaceae bacterium CS5]TXL03845.1 DNA polymerase III subunit alpha [Methylococcaceae bacterium CS1]TXL05128.1 DNA polymerase III subunit alpha [Methylococcaceae bacterium CS3]TXL10090.1 DNA polymerase III subunit alpha [Methylococcaceae bacterium CS2]